MAKGDARALKRILDLARDAGLIPGAVIDIGVATGTPGLYDTWPDRPLVLVDPTPETLPLMQRIAAEYPDVRIFNVGASNASGEMRARILEANGQAVLGSHTQKPGWRNILVPVMRVDEIIAAAGVRGPFLYKLDTDTHEGEIIEGSEETLRKTELVIVETGFYNRRKGKLATFDLVRMLHERGFAMIDVARVGHATSGVARLADLVFAREEGPLFEALFRLSAATPAQLEARRQAREDALKSRT